MTCNHDMDKQAICLPIFNAVGEVWICECGALLNVSDDATNYGERALTAPELERLVMRLVQRRVKSAMFQLAAELTNAIERVKKLHGIKD